MKAEIEKSLTRGCEWLIVQQADDGGWHSKTYGQLKDGAAVTALALHTLSLCSKEIRQQHAGAIERGFAFLDSGIEKRGTLASPDGSLDFPTYAAALWLSAVNRLWHPRDSRKVVEYLVGAQVVEARGFDKSSPSYGGWDFLGPDDAKGITTGTNISVTRHALEALAIQRDRNQKGGLSREATEALKDPIQGTGKAYVLRCQQADGGFAFTCEPASLNNKAAYSESELTKPRSYGTATCDGVLALVACIKATAPGGLPDFDKPVTIEDPAITKALAWLAKRPGLELVPGFEGFPPEAGWDRGLRFYYYAALSRVLPLFPLSERDSRSAALARHIIGLQQEDGRWENESDRMRENDPLIATALAVVALANH
ncbi:MAG TPA: prenyltransferase/squalene oxidase repeat-containing protein [Pirellulaceae bacterium]|nr:prenyltransferase/squalene oxidase repeat-containing protein [Pirellulaceae bacterium]